MFNEEIVKMSESLSKEDTLMSIYELGDETANSYISEQAAAGKTKAETLEGLFMLGNEQPTQQVEQPQTNIVQPEANTTTIPTSMSTPISSTGSESGGILGMNISDIRNQELSPEYYSQKEKEEQSRTLAEKAQKEANELGFSEPYIDPLTGNEVGSVQPEGAMPDLPVAFGKLATFGIASAAGYGGYKLATGLAFKEAKALTQYAKKDPKFAEDMLDAVKFAKENNIPIPKAVWQDDKIVKTGNSFLDVKLTNIRENYKDLEYDTMSKALSNIAEGPVTSTEISKMFQHDMSKKYDEFAKVSKQKWDAYNAQAENIGLSKNAQQKFMKEVDEALPNADVTVKNFISRTLFKNKEEGTMFIKQLDEEASTLKNRIKQFSGNLSKSEQATKTRYESELRSKLRDIAKTESEMLNKPLELADLVAAKQTINNKMFVKGGAISTGNKLERKHLLDVNEILDKQIESMSSPQARQALAEARESSKQTFETFGYDLTGVNKGQATDLSGKIIKEHEVGAIKEFEKELMSADVDVALQKFKKYETLLDSPESVKQAKKLYVSKLFGLDLSKLTSETGLQGLQLDDKLLSQGLTKALDSEASRKLTKDIFGDEGFKNLVALKKLDRLLKAKISSDSTTWWKEATSGFDSTVGGIIMGTTKLLKSATTDILTYPFLNKSQKYNTLIINKLTKELDKANGKPGTVQKLINELDTMLNSGGYKNMDEMNAAAGGGKGSIDSPMGREYDLGTKGDKASVFKIDETHIGVDMLPVKTMKQGLGTKFIDDVIKEFPDKKILITEDTTPRAKEFFKKMMVKYPGKFVLDDGVKLGVLGLTTAAVTAPQDANASSFKKLPPAEIRKQTDDLEWLVYADMQELIQIGTEYTKSKNFSKDSEHYKKVEKLMEKIYTKSKSGKVITPREFYELRKVVKYQGKLILDDKVKVAPVADATEPEVIANIQAIEPEAIATIQATKPSNIHIPSFNYNNNSSEELRQVAKQNNSKDKNSVKNAKQLNLLADTKDILSIVKEPMSKMDKESTKYKNVEKKLEVLYNKMMSGKVLTPRDYQELKKAIK